jgi:excisionase family DNA binding protein
MITIPLNTNTGITIPARNIPTKQKSEQAEATPRMSVSIPEAAKIIGVGKPLMLRLIKEGKIRTIKIGKRVVVSIQSLRHFIDGEKAPCDSMENSDESQGEYV